MITEVNFMNITDELLRFNGKALVSILEQDNGSSINHYEAQAFLKQLIDR